MMDPFSFSFSIAAIIIAVLQLTASVLRNITDVHDAGHERDKYYWEALNLYGLLTTLRLHVESGRYKEFWCQVISTIAAKDGALQQYQTELESLGEKIRLIYSVVKAPGALGWKFIKDDVKDLLAKMDCLKTLVQNDLDIDHL
jgi:hypothetical protein